ncbi:hypothetical protein BDY21DRAFT_317672 [Lineolata rhizophorae]|uniref:Sacsin/Nov domain-containing protein n=1 Tax=Lineolata rhizophorae TaxID=578093 RepID=A0A6A6P6R2_9PEZI|nr:hypothetical protein BDY21DRAFT_317672 [Lineolata rhizophorae]
MASLSREEGRQFIRKIGVDNGWISDEDRQKTPENVLQSMEILLRKLGSSTKALATNLYSKDTRFLYELIQNADDNQYDRARAAGESPFLSFQIFPDKIIIDSNENGFTERNVKAICSMGESTKSNTGGYIGEKGIGFKSVFKVAKKVHVQSGPFSFSFKHTRDSDENGLGMVTPFNEEYDDLPPSVRTRMSLTFHGISCFEQIVEDFLNLPDTLLLFLVRLERIHVKVHRSEEVTEDTEICYPRQQSVGESLQTLTKVCKQNGKELRTHNKYHVVQKAIVNLPPDAARASMNHATVVLAFPINDSDTPIVQPQHVFAFLPVRKVGFNFLIQSDFITQANREDIFHSPRNQALVSGVADAFHDAVIRFCRHPSLQYSWMRYLPTDTILDDFWDKLREQIYSRLRTTAILRSRLGTLRGPGQLRILSAEYCDDDGEPLVADLTPELYLSDKYRKGDVNTLRLLGLADLRLPEFLERFGADLERQESRFKNPSTDDAWYAKISNVLCRPFERRQLSSLKNTVRDLPLIPLQDKTWVSSHARTYFPTTGSSPIPKDIGLKLVQPELVQRPGWKHLLSQLGVDFCELSQVISLIRLKYKSPLESKAVTPSESVSHLVYLFWNLQEHEDHIDDCIWIMDDKRRRIRRSSFRQMPIYFRDLDDYKPFPLFWKIQTKDENAPGLEVSFINDFLYLGAVKDEARNHGRSWTEWLEDVVGIKRAPVLADGEGKLSREFKYIISHRSQKLLSTLKAHWGLYEAQLQMIKAALISSYVTSDTGMRVQLGNSYLPLPELKEAVASLKISKFPFVKIDQSLKDEERDEWAFVSGLKVGIHLDLRFRLDALAHAAIFSPARASAFPPREPCPDVIDNLFEFYGAIQFSCSTEEEKELVRKYFDKKSVIYVPFRLHNGVCAEASWRKSNECVWDAPSWLTTKSPLRGVGRYDELRTLFKRVLKVPDTHWEDVVDELNLRKSKMIVDPITLESIYHRLMRDFEQDSGFDQIREYFERFNLIYVPSKKTWCAPSSCLWAEDTIQIPRKESIATPYASLEGFFTKILGIRTPDVGMHVQALLEQARELAQGVDPVTHSEKLKERMTIISSMKPTETDLAPLRKSRIFLVKLSGGTINWADRDSDFAIADKPEYQLAFQGKAALLDFTLAEIRACMLFLMASGLERRYMSLAVDEQTEVEGGNSEPKLTDKFRSRAYAFFRCAVHYSSPKVTHRSRSLYDLFVAAEVYESDGISKTMTLFQYDKFIKIGGKKSNFHLDDNGDQLRLYVPKNRTDRDLCFLRQLPKRLVAFLSITEPKAESIIQSILNCSGLPIVDEILNDEGIVEVEGIDRPAESDIESEQLSENEAALTSPHRSRLSSAISETAHSEVSGDEDEVQTTSTSLRSTRIGHAARQRSYVPFASPTPASSPEIELQEPDQQGERYRALLNHVIVAASRATFPICRTATIAIGDGARFGTAFLALVNNFTVRSQIRDIKVGAAGELFVFELLKQLKLPQFSAEMWKSTIRKEVKVHENYSDLEPWHGVETADIVYPDGEGDFTRLLIERGYFGPAWANAKPTYYIEVKTTTGECADEFYMSGAQYNRMQGMRLESDRPAANVYMLFRVFNLTRESIGLRLHLDPETCRREGELSFHADKYAVRQT